MIQVRNCLSLYMKFDFPKHRVLRTPATLHPTEYTKGWNLHMYWYKIWRCVMDCKGMYTCFKIDGLMLTVDRISLLEGCIILIHDPPAKVSPRVQRRGAFALVALSISSSVFSVHNTIVAQTHWHESLRVCCDIKMIATYWLHMHVNLYTQSLHLYWCILCLPTFKSPLP